MEGKRLAKVDAKAEGALKCCLRAIKRKNSVGGAFGRRDVLRVSPIKGAEDNKALGNISVRNLKLKELQEVL